MKAFSAVCERIGFQHICLFRINHSPPIPSNAHAFLWGVFFIEAKRKKLNPTIVVRFSPYLLTRSRFSVTISINNSGGAPCEGDNLFAVPPSYPCLCQDKQEKRLFPAIGSHLLKLQITSYLFLQTFVPRWKRRILLLFMEAVPANPRVCVWVMLERCFVRFFTTLNAVRKEVLTMSMLKWWLFARIVKFVYGMLIGTHSVY